MKPTLLQRVSLLLLLVTVCAFYVAAIRPGHDWDDDSAMYILHARNLAEGRAYTDTGYIFNPEYAALGPQSYPPGFPILLAPLWALRGLDLTAMKILGVACFAGSLVFVSWPHKAFSGSPLSPLARIVLVALLALSPPYVQHVDFVGSDFPFLLLIFAALLCLEQIYSSPNPPLISALPASLLIFAAYSTRTVGVALIPSLALFEVINYRKISPSALLAGALAAILCAVEFLALNSSGANPSLFNLNIHTIAANFLIYAATLGRFFLGGPSLSRLLCGVFTVLAFVQVVLQIRSTKRLPIAWIFGILYLCVLLVYQPNEPRFLFPIFPIFIALAVGALERLLHGAVSHWTIRGGSLGRPVAGIAVTTAVLIAFGAAYAGSSHEPIREGFLDPDFVRLTEFLRSQTQPLDTILFRKPRWLTLLTLRRALTYAPVQGLGEFVHGVQPNYLVVTESPQVGLASDEQFLWPYIREHEAALRLVYRNAEFRVYHVLAW
jgi:hypothetical protein